jgi:hypothetical protein
MNNKKIYGIECEYNGYVYQSIRVFPDGRRRFYSTNSSGRWTRIYFTVK